MIASAHRVPEPGLMPELFSISHLTQFSFKNPRAISIFLLWGRVFVNRAYHQYTQVYNFPVEPTPKEFLLPRYR